MKIDKCNYQSQIIDTSEIESLMKLDAPEIDTIKNLHHKLIKQYHQVNGGGLLNR